MVHTWTVLHVSHCTYLPRTMTYPIIINVRTPWPGATNLRGPNPNICPDPNPSQPTSGGSGAKICPDSRSKLCAYIRGSFGLVSTWTSTAAAPQPFNPSEKPAGSGRVDRPIAQGHSSTIAKGGIHGSKSSARDWGLGGTS